MLSAGILPLLVLCAVVFTSIVPSGQATSLSQNRTWDFFYQEAPFTRSDSAAIPELYRGFEIYSYDIAPGSLLAPKNVIGFAEGTGKTAFAPNRLQHASRHLTDSGILPNWSKATGQKFTEIGTKILEKPSATFDHVLRGGQKVKGFIGKVDGQDVAIMVYKEGKFQGQVATAVVPSPAQMTNWGVLP